MSRVGTTSLSSRPGAPFVVASRRGELLVFAATKEKKLLSETDLGSPISGLPVAANGVLDVTTMRQLYAVQKQ